MKVIVCGAGQVGSNIARHLAEEQNDVTIIDQSPELIRRISEAYDVRGLVGFASHPDMLDRAGAVEHVGVGGETHQAAHVVGLADPADQFG